MIPLWYLLFSVVVAFVMGMIAYRLMVLALRPRPRYRRRSR
jgi:hypothetical protein